MNFCLIGNPENRRCAYFIQAVLSQGFAPPQVISYLDILNNKVDLDAIFKQNDCLRMESFGENFEVWRSFLSLGENHPYLGEASKISSLEAQKLVFENGRICYLRQAHLGFLEFLKSIESKLQNYPHLRLMNSVEGIKLVFDKIACHQHFAQHQISVPPASYTVQSYDDLQEQMRINRWSRVFIKPVFGSSASGVIAYRTYKNKEQAITSTELVKTSNGFELYNSLKIKTYTDKESIKTIINYLAKEGILVEQWIPKATFEEGSFDLRMVVIGGKTSHVVVRQSKLPITNLHLGNQRGKLELLQQYLGEEKWQSLCQLAEQVVTSLPQMFYAGLDVMLSNNLQKNYVLEANAFGDLLPNVLVGGKDTYTTTVDNFCKTFS